MATPMNPDETPDTIIGISFDDAFRAQELLTAAYRLASMDRLELRDAVTIVKDPEGRTFVRETIDPQPAQSALSTGMWAGLFGLILGGPVGWLAGTAIGAGAGAARAKVVDLGIPDEWVRWFRDAVQPGTVTLVLLAGRFDREAVISELERFSGARLVYSNVPSDAIGRIREALRDVPPDDAPPDDARAEQVPADAAPPSDPPLG